MKTIKAATKRLKLTRRKKVMFRPSRQNHFNAKQSGDSARKKRHAGVMQPNMSKVFEKVMER